MGSTKILSATNDSVETIDLNPFLKKRPFDFGEIIEEVRLIPLESTEEAFLTRIDQLKMTDSHIYIMDDKKGSRNNEVVIFDRKGRFIKRIPKGKGPGELSRAYKIEFDEVANELIVDVHSYLKFFSPEGKFIRQWRYPFFFHGLTTLPDGNGYVFKSMDREGNEHMGHLADYLVKITDKDFHLNSVAMFAKPTEVIFHGNSYFHKNNGELYVTDRFQDTVFQITSASEIKARYVLDYNDNRLPQHYVYGKNEEFRKVRKRGEYAYYMGAYADVGTHQFFRLTTEDRTALIFRDKSTGVLKGGNGRKGCVEVPNNWFFRQWTAGDYFVSYYTPMGAKPFPDSSIIPEEDKARARNLEEGDNIVLVLYKLKRFEKEPT
ncbi:6-bladed beta-propeller [Fulvitalea axinellae]